MCLIAVWILQKETLPFLYDSNSKTLDAALSHLRNDRISGIICKYKTLVIQCGLCLKESSKRIRLWLFREMFSNAHISLSSLFFSLKKDLKLLQNSRMSSVSIFLCSVDFEKSIAHAVLLILA